MSPNGQWAAVLSIAAGDGEVPVEPSLLGVREVGSGVVVWERPIMANLVDVIAEWP